MDLRKIERDDLMKKFAMIVVISLLMTGCSESRDAPINDEGTDVILPPIEFDQSEMEKFTEDYAIFSTTDALTAYSNALSSSVSTVSVDVDTASYTHLRKALLSGYVPTAGSIRVEEMINYFDYDLNLPEDDDVVGVTKEIGVAPWNDQHQLLMIGLRTEDIVFEDTPGNNLVFLLDVSGSMSNEDKLPLLVNAMKLLVSQLRPQDRISIVVYAGAAGVVLEGAAGNDQEAITEALDSLSAGGSTAGGEGIQLAYEIAEKYFVEGGNNRVILGTDGDFNVGISQTSELEEFISSKRGTGVFLSVLGFGSGHQDVKMETLADKGNGVYYYIDSLLEAKKVFMEELGSSLITIAKDVKIQIEFNPIHVKGYRLIGYENRVLDYEDFDDDQKDAGDLGAGHQVIFFYEIIPTGSTEEVDPDNFIETELLRYNGTNHLGEIASLAIRYKHPQSDDSLKFEKQIYVSDITSNPSEDFRFASSVVEFGMLLRDSVHLLDSSYDQVLDRATLAIGDDEYGHRYEFTLLVERAKQILDEE